MCFTLIKECQKALFSFNVLIRNLIRNVPGNCNFACWYIIASWSFWFTYERYKIVYFLYIIVIPYNWFNAQQKTRSFPCIVICPWVCIVRSWGTMNSVWLDADLLFLCSALTYSFSAHDHRFWNHAPWSGGCLLGWHQDTCSGGDDVTWRMRW